MVALFLRSILFLILAASLVHAVGFDEEMGMPVRSIEMNDECLNRDSCRHDITLFLADHHEKIVTMSSTEIADHYWIFLTDTQQNHLLHDPKVQRKKSH